MRTATDPAVELLTIELPASVVSALRAEAEAEGRDAESLAADRLSNFYAVAANEPEASATQDALHGPAHRFDPEAIHRATCEKYGVANLSPLSKEELEKHTEAIFARVDPKKLAEAERLGLI